APDRGDEVVLAHHAVAVLDQVDEKIEHLRLDGDRLGTAPQLSQPRVKYMIGKEKSHVSPRRSLSRNNQAVLGGKSRLPQGICQAHRLYRSLRSTAYDSDRPRMREQDHGAPTLA